MIRFRVDTDRLDGTEAVGELLRADWAHRPVISWLIARGAEVRHMTTVEQQTSDAGLLRDPLVAARAASELAARRRLAAAIAAADSGRTQRDIASALGISQPAVAQLLARARRWPGDWQRTPRQVALEYAAGELSRDQMRHEFVTWTWTSGHFDGPGGPNGEWAEAWVSGSWDELTTAVSDGLIDGDDYEYVFVKTR